MSEFGITINDRSLSVFSSYADTYCSTNPLQKCTHANNSSCSDSVAYTNGSTILQSFHHTNIYNILFRIPFPDTSQSLKVAYIGHNYCTEDHHDDQPFYGLTCPDLGLAVITNFNSQTSETKTLIHEFGHFYGVLDHYGDSAPSTSQMGGAYSSSCIYGERKEEPDVINDYKICDGCKAIILANLNLYNH